MPVNLSLSTGGRPALPVRPFRSFLGDSKFMKRPALALSTAALLSPAPRRLWAPGLLDRLRMPISRIRE